MGQNNVCRLESPEYGKYTLSSLKRIAEALDVALEVRLVPFSQFISWLSGSEYLDQGLRPDALAVPSFEEEEKTGEIDQTLVPQKQMMWGEFYDIPRATQISLPVVATGVHAVLPARVTETKPAYPNSGVVYMQKGAA